MDHAQTTTEKSEKKVKKAFQAVEEDASDAAHGLQERVEQVRDIVENVREQAATAFRDKPYLVPVAAGALGLGIGVLLGSRLTRFIVFTAVSSLVSEALGGEVRRAAGRFIGEFQHRLNEGEHDEDEQEQEGPHGHLSPT